MNFTDLVPKDFTPNATVYTFANNEGIPITFVDEEVNGFIAYWTLRGTRRSLRGWDMTFLNRIRYKWAAKKKEEKNTGRNNASHFKKDYEVEKVKKSDSKLTLRERLRQ